MATWSQEFLPGHSSLQVSASCQPVLAVSRLHTSSVYMRSPYMCICLDFLAEQIRDSLGLLCSPSYVSLCFYVPIGMGQMQGGLTFAQGCGSPGSQSAAPHWGRRAEGDAQPVMHMGQLLLTVSVDRDREAQLHAVVHRSLRSPRAPLRT